METSPAAEMQNTNQNVSLQNSQTPSISREQKKGSVKAIQGICAILALLMLSISIFYLASLNADHVDIAFVSGLQLILYAMAFYALFVFHPNLIRILRIVLFSGIIMTLFMGVGHIIIFMLEITGGFEGNYVSELTRGIPLSELDPETRSQVVSHAISTFLVLAAIYFSLFILPLSLISLFVNRIYRDLYHK